jgi:hypothetical protein
MHSIYVGLVAAAAVGLFSEPARADDDALPTERGGYPHRMPAMEVPPPAPPPAAKSPLKRPGMLVGGLVFSAIGTAGWIWNGVMISDTVASCNRARIANKQDFGGVWDQLACDISPAIEVPVGIVASGALIAGVSLTVVSFIPKSTRRSGPLYDLADPPAPAFRLAVTPQGIVVQGAF